MSPVALLTGRRVQEDSKAIADGIASDVAKLGRPVMDAAANVAALSLLVLTDIKQDVYTPPKRNAASAV